MTQIQRLIQQIFLKAKVLLLNINNKSVLLNSLTYIMLEEEIAWLVVRFGYVVVEFTQFFFLLVKYFYFYVLTFAGNQILLKWNFYLNLITL